MDKKSGWKRFQKVRFSSRTLSSRAKRAETATTKHAHKFVLSRLRSLSESRQAILSWLALVGVVIAATAGQLAMVINSVTTKVAADGGTYSEGLVGDIATLNPLFSASPAELAASKLIFSSLYDYDATGSLQRDLAAGIETNRDKTQYKIKLRADALWHDGQPVTVNDVLYTVQAMKDPKIRAVQAITWQDIEVSKIDDKTLLFKLPAAYASFVHALTFPVLPAHILRGLPQDTLRQNTFSAQPVGSGPFEVRLLQSQNIPRKQKTVYLAANSNYYRGEPKLSRFEIHAYTSADDLKAALETNDIIAAIDKDIEVAHRLPSRFSSIYQPVNNGVYALFNTNRGVLQDKNVRKSLQIGTDTNKLLRLLGSTHRQLDHPLLQSQLPDVKLAKKPTYNIGEAKKLLDKAGWKLRGDVRVKNKKQLELRLAMTKNPNYDTIQKGLVEQWRQLGVKTEVVEFDPSKTSQNFAQTVLQPRDYDVLINELVLGADPDVYPYWHSSQANILRLNFSNYRNDFADFNLATARSADDTLVRNEKYARFVKQWMSDAPAIALYQTSVAYITAPSAQPDIKNIVTPMQRDGYSNVLYWTAEEASVYTTP